jgi:hypothetical protein
MIASANATFVTIYIITVMISPLHAQEQNFVTYNDPDNLFTIKYPSDWDINNETLTGERLGSEYVGYIEFNMRDKVTDQLMYTGINIKVQKEPEQLETLQDVRRNMLIHPDATLAKAENPVIEPTTLSEQEAFKISFHHPPLSLSEGCGDIVPPLEIIRVITFDPQTKYSYTVELSALPVLFSELVPTFETSLNSFRIT